MFPVQEPDKYYLVTGQMSNNYEYCYAARSNEQLCGESGKFYAFFGSLPQDVSPQQR